MKRLSATQRKHNLVNAGLYLAEKHGFHTLTCTSVCRAAGLKSHGMVAYHFGSMQKLRDCVMQRAIALPQLQVVAAGIIAKHPAAAHIPSKLHKQALAAIRNG